MFSKVVEMPKVSEDIMLIIFIYYEKCEYLFRNILEQWTHLFDDPFPQDSVRILCLNTKSRANE